MQSERKAKQKSQNIDWITLVLVVGLVAFGIVTIANVLADPFTSTQTSLSDIMSNLNLEYVQKQIVNFLVGLAALFVMLAIDY